MEEDIKEILTALDNTTKKQLDEAIANADKEWSEMELEEDIKILEEFIEDYENEEFVTQDRVMRAIEHLIARNKELEEDNKKLQKYMKDFLIPKSTINLVYIPKSKIRELKENIHCLLDNNGITRAYQLEIDRLFEELLED